MQESQSSLKSTAITPKKLRRRKKQKQIVPGSLVEYGNPECKVVVRLLPPTLDQAEFLGQVEKNAPTFSTKVQTMVYKKGSSAAQKFDEPDSSSASFKFPSRESAEAFKTEMGKISFKEPRTGDQMKCKVMNPIIGEICAATAVNSEDYAIMNHVFKSFADRRNTDGYADIHEVLLKVKAATKQKKNKNKVKQRKKLPEKVKPVQSNTKEPPSIGGNKKQKPNMTTNSSGSPARPHVTKQGDSQSNQVEAKKAKKKPKKFAKSEKAISEKAASENSISPPTAKPKSHKRKSKNKEKPVTESGSVSKGKVRV